MNFKRNHVILAIFISFGTLASQATTHALYEASIAQKHEQWMAKHGRVYPDSSEKERRFAIFTKNVEFVEKFNKEGNKTYKLSINKFSDMTNEEFMRHHTGYKVPTGSSTSTSFKNNFFQYQSLADTDIPTSMDWREQAAVTGIKDQGRCGACWAFTVVAAVEGLTKIKTGQLISLSEQQLVDCSHQNGGCRGGSLESAYEYVIQNGGIAREENYQYQSTDMETCDTNKVSMLHRSLLMKKSLSEVRTIYSRLCPCNQSRLALLLMDQIFSITAVVCFPAIVGRTLTMPSPPLDTGRLKMESPTGY